MVSDQKNGNEGLKGWLKGDRGVDALQDWLKQAFPQDMQKEISDILSDDRPKDAKTPNNVSSYEDLKEEYLMGLELDMELEQESMRQNKRNFL